MKPIVVYGIPNCDTVKRARAWLAERALTTDWHDFKKQGVPADRLDAWMAALGWEALLNTRGTTWRGLDEGLRAAVHDAASAASLLKAHPSAIRRPVVEWPDGRITAGFDADDWSARLG